MNFKEMPKLSTGQAQELLREFIKTNVKLEKEGKPMNAISLLGHAGIGKTSIMTQAAEKMGLDYEIIRLSNIDDAGELIGFPIKEFLMNKEGQESIWVQENDFEQFIKLGFHSSGQTRTGYAPPAWLTRLNTNPSLLIIDDYSRGSQRFMQALMSIVNERSYYSWSLPEGCNVVLTGNPADEGDYFVSDMDLAQKSRFFEFGVEFNIDDWIEHAVTSGNIDSRCINFMAAYYSEILYDSKGNMLTNPRQWTKFFNAIKYIEDFQSPNSLSLIQTIGSGIVTDHISFFTTFINQKLDKLPEPNWIIEEKNYSSVSKKIKDVIGELKSSTEKYKPEIASIISQRILLYLLNRHLDEPVSKETIDRLEDLVKDNVFSGDLELMLSKSLMANKQSKYQKVCRKFISKMATRDTFRETFKSYQ